MQSTGEFDLVAFPTLLEALPIGVMLVGEDGLIAFLNRPLALLFGYTREELLRQPVEILLPAQMRASHPELRRGFFEKPAARPMGAGRDLRARRKDGSEFPVEIGLNPISLQSGRFVVVNVADITARKRTEAERRELQVRMQETQKLESLGVLAGGIAHDFNNLLVGILGNAELVRDELPQGSIAIDYVSEIEDTAKRLADLCRQLLAYSGRGKVITEQLSLNDLVREMARLLELSISKKAILRLNLAQDLPPVAGDATQMRQVVMNLITNASDALCGNAGVISISTSAGYCDLPYLQQAFPDVELPEGAYVRLEVSDTGCGMTPEVMAHIFDPFYSTKSTGRGLGLAAALGIVRSHKGAIRVYSEPGRGSTFRLLLPAVGELPSTATHNRAQTPPGSRGTVLVVDDEPRVRQVAARILAREGFHVEQASDGANALELLQAHKDQIVLILLDLIMPNLDGRETLRAIHQRGLSVPVLLFSGYSEHDLAIEFAGRNTAGFLQKPFTREALLEIVNRILEGTPHAAPGKPG